MGPDDPTQLTQISGSYAPEVGPDDPTQLTQESRAEEHYTETSGGAKSESIEGQQGVKTSQTTQNKQEEEEEEKERESPEEKKKESVKSHKEIEPEDTSDEETPVWTSKLSDVSPFVEETPLEKFDRSGTEPSEDVDVEADVDVDMDVDVGLSAETDQTASEDRLTVLPTQQQQEQLIILESQDAESEKEEHTSALQSEEMTPTSARVAADGLVEGLSDTLCVAGEEVTFLLHAVDKLGKRLDRGGDPFTVSFFIDDPHKK